MRTLDRKERDRLRLWLLVEDGRGRGRIMRPTVKASACRVLASCHAWTREEAERRLGAKANHERTAQ